VVDIRPSDQGTAVGLEGGATCCCMARNLLRRRRQLWARRQAPQNQPPATQQQQQQQQQQTRPAAGMLTRSISSSWCGGRIACCQGRKGGHGGGAHCTVLHLCKAACCHHLQPQSSPRAHCRHESHAPCPVQVYGTLFECPSKYAPIKPIGKGAYGVVCSARNLESNEKARGTLHAMISALRACRARPPLGCPCRNARRRQEGAAAP
jgi:hypothetical protein